MLAARKTVPTENKTIISDHPRYHRLDARGDEDHPDSGLAVVKYQ